MLFKVTIDAREESNAYLVPALNGRSDRVKKDGVIKRPRMAPAMSDLVSEGLAVVLVQVFLVLEAGGVLSHNGALS
jgi:hypothetical protein